jgi:hypothetical protein
VKAGPLRKHLSLTLVSAFTLALVAIAPQAAHAAPIDDTPEPYYSVTVPLTAVGFDPAVARAHGFTAITGPDGIQSPAPVNTRASIRQVNEFVPRSASFRSPVTGNCGTSNFELTVLGSQLLGATTSYKVRLPIVSRTWSWTAVSFHGILTKPWPGGAGGSSSSQKTIWTVNPYGWWGQVDLGSHVILTDGTICASGLPASGT